VFDFAVAQAQRRRDIRNRPLFHPEKDLHEGVFALEGCVFETDEVCVFRGVLCSISQPHKPSAAVRFEIGLCFILKRTFTKVCLR